MNEDRMFKPMVLLYDLALLIYQAGIWASAPFNLKARKWIRGRRNIFEQIEGDFHKTRKVGAKIIWMHCASLGEFEQGRTVLDVLRKGNPGIGILLTFFSPSGLELRKNYLAADWVHYLPLDTASNAKRFLQITKPSVAIFVKYEFWYHYLHELKKTGTPAILMAAIFQPTQPFFKWYGKIFRQMLSCFSKILVQDNGSKDLLNSLNIATVIIAGDTRVDRVYEVAGLYNSIPYIESFCNGKKVIIFGSTWPRDIKVIIPFINSRDTMDWKFIIAPHEVDQVALKRIEKKLGIPSVRYSEIKKQNSINGINVLIIDTIGILSSIYRMGKIAYIGGGFGKGIHNILEPAAFGLPVVFGPHYHKFLEARSLISSGGAFTIASTKDLMRVFSFLEKKEHYDQSSKLSKSYILSNKGSTAMVANEIMTYLI